MIIIPMILNADNSDIDMMTWLTKKFSSTCEMILVIEVVDIMQNAL